MLESGLLNEQKLNQFLECDKTWNSAFIFSFFNNIYSSVYCDLRMKLNKTGEEI